MSHYVRIAVTPEPLTTTFALHVAEERGSSIAALTETRFTPVDDGVAAPSPLLRIGEKAAVDLVTTLWNAGVRPRVEPAPGPPGTMLALCAEGAQIIERTNNGWLVRTIENDEGYGVWMSSMVYQDSDDTVDTAVGNAESLKDALRDTFGEYLQTKRSGGLRLAVEEKGHDNT